MVIPGLFLGSFRDGKDRDQLEANRITHIISIHDNARKVVEMTGKREAIVALFKPGVKLAEISNRFNSPGITVLVAGSLLETFNDTDKQYLCIRVPDAPDENLSKYFSQCNDFIHGARTRGGNVLIHCLAGVSRSATIATAYVMSITSLSSKEALKVIRGARTIASPNYGFLTQLREFEFHSLPIERKRIKSKYPNTTDSEELKDECDKLVKVYYATVEKPSALPQAAAGISPLNSPRRHRSYPPSPRRSNLYSFSPASSSPSTPSTSRNSSPHGSPRKQRYGTQYPPSPRKS